MKQLFSIVVLGVILLFTGCGPKTPLDEGIDALNNGDFNSALEFFKTVDGQDKEKETLKDIPEVYLESKKLYNDGEYFLAYEKMKNMPGAYADYGVKEEIDNFTKEVDKKATIFLKNEKFLEEINESIYKEELKEAKEKIKAIEELKELTKDQKEKVEEYKAIIEVLEK